MESISQNEDIVSLNTAMFESMNDALEKYGDTVLLIRRQMNHLIVELLVLELFSMMLLENLLPRCHTRTL